MNVIRLTLKFRYHNEIYYLFHLSLKSINTHWRLKYQTKIQEAALNWPSVMNPSSQYPTVIDQMMIDCIQHEYFKKNNILNSNRCQVTSWYFFPN